jgi:hypothetical protein
MEVGGDGYSCGLNGCRRSAYYAYGRSRGTPVKFACTFVPYMCIVSCLAAASLKN